MTRHYLPVLMMLAIVLAIGVAALVVSGLANWFARVRKPYPEKNSPYECGFPPFESARIPFDIRFYLVAILFIIFDLETAFLFPWAAALRQIGWPGFYAMMFFLGLLTLGFLYEWRKGALEWE